MLSCYGSLVVAKVFIITVARVLESLNIASSCDKLPVCTSVLHLFYFIYKISSYPKLCNCRFDF